MVSTLDQARKERPLKVKSISSVNLKNRLEHMGLHLGSEIEVLSDDSVLHPVRVKGPQGEVLLAAGMASKVIVHHDDGHKTPVFEMNPGETGHIEGLTSGSHLEKSLKTLGLAEGDNIKLIRCLPPMEYIAVVDGRQTSLTEGMAAKLWGTCDKCQSQLATCGRGREFEVLEILGGPRAVKTISAGGINVGSNIVLESVQPAKDISIGFGDRIIIRSKDGLRLHLRLDQAATMLVEEL